MPISRTLKENSRDKDLVMFEIATTWYKIDRDGNITIKGKIVPVADEPTNTEQ